MTNNSANPGIILASVMTVTVVGGFLLVVDTGMNARKAQDIHFELNPATQESAVARFFNDFEVGKQVIKSKSDHFMATFFDAPAAAESASAQEETASAEAPREEGSAPYSNRKKFWEDDYSGSGDTENGFHALSGGGEPPMGNSMSLGLSAAVRDGAAAKNINVMPDSAPSVNKRPAHASRGIFGGAAISDERAVAPKLYAALSGNGAPQNTAQNPGQPWAGGSFSGDGAASPRKGGTISGMPGQNAGASLGGASEGMKSASQSDYNSKMGSGASAAASAAASGGAAPAVSAPQKVSAGGEAGGSSAKTADKAAKTASDEKTGTDAGTGKSAAVTPPAEDNTPDLLKTVVYEKLNGMDTKYVSQQEAAGAPDEKLLKAGGIAAAPVTKSLSASAPDPADLNSLSDKRKAELKKELHVFMAELENKYGKMTDLYRTSCDLTPDVCKAGGVTGSYLTMTTAKGATIVFSLKYANGKWQLYTMDFKAPKYGLGT